MTISVLGISTSPRAGGNSSLLLRQALSGAVSAGAKVEYINLFDYNIGPCVECNNCFKTGVCSIADDYGLIMKKLLDSDRLIFATPIFFMNVCAQAKTLIDRGQCLWARKYILKKDFFDCQRDRRAMVIAVGGSKSKKQIEGVRWTMKTYFDAIQFKYVSGLYVNQVDAAKTIQQHPTALQEAFRLGGLLASQTPTPQAPTEVELP